MDPFASIDPFATDPSIEAAFQSLPDGELIEVLVTCSSDDEVAENNDEWCSPYTQQGEDGDVFDIIDDEEP